METSTKKRINITKNLVLCSHLIVTKCNDLLFATKSYHFYNY